MKRVGAGLGLLLPVLVLSSGSDSELKMFRLKNETKFDMKSENQNQVRSMEEIMKSRKILRRKAINL